MTTTNQAPKFTRVSSDTFREYGLIITDQFDGTMSQCFIVDGKRYLVERIRIIGSQWLSYKVWEMESDHSTITTTYINDELPLDERIKGSNVVHWGKLGSRRLPADIEALPRGEERFAAVDAFQQEQYQMAYDLIREAYPEATVGTEDMGEIELFF